MKPVLSALLYVNEYYIEILKTITKRRVKLEKKNFRFETEVIHSGYSSDEHQGSLVPPLYQTSTFTFASAEQGERRFAGQEEGFIYSRLGNPTVKILEDRMAKLEQGEAALAFSSGMAAVCAVLTSLNKNRGPYSCVRKVYMAVPLVFCNC